MKKDIMKRWVEALRSGKFKQTTGSLRNYQGYCCLGVLCHIHAKENNKRFRRLRPTERFTYHGAEEFIPVEVIKWSGLFGYNPSGKNAIPLSKTNDSGGTFESIANIIENDYKEL